MVTQTQDPAVQQLQRQVAELSSIVKKPTKIDRYLDQSSKDIINDVVSDSVIDTVWNRYFYYHTFYH